MPHKCMKCNKIYSDEEIVKLKFCKNCGGKFFIYAKTEEELMKREHVTTEEEKIFGVSGEIEVKRIGETVIITKVGVEKENNIKEKKIEKEPSYIIEKEESTIPYLWDNEAYKKRITTPREPVELKTSIKTPTEHKQDRSDGLLKLKKEKEEKTDLEWLEEMYGGNVKGVVSLDIETLKILRTGQYEIDIAGLMSNKPLILSPREGTFYIDLQSAMVEALKKKRKMEK